MDGVVDYLTLEVSRRGFDRKRMTPALRMIGSTLFYWTQSRGYAEVCLARDLTQLVTMGCKYDPTLPRLGPVKSGACELYICFRLNLSPGEAKLGGVHCVSRLSKAGILKRGRLSWSRASGMSHTAICGGCLAIASNTKPHTAQPGQLPQPSSPPATNTQRIPSSQWACTGFPLPCPTSCIRLLGESNPPPTTGSGPYRALTNTH